MNILEKIRKHKIQEVVQRRKQVSIASLEQSAFFKRAAYSMVEYLRRPDKSGLISEFKRQSPSKGIINAHSTVAEVTKGYIQAGVSGLSVLTDGSFFGGQMEDLLEARRHNACPILRKDFIVDEYQIIEAKSFGADLILLIGDMLTKPQVKHFSSFAKNLGLEVLMEVHDEQPLGYLTEHVDMVGVNNRDLTTFSVDIKTSERLAALIPSQFVKISESGISAPESVVHLKPFGFEGFLIGEHFMKEAFPEKACADFIAQINALESKSKLS